MCVCAYVGAWVRGCAPNFAEVSKIVRDATRAGRNTSTGAGAPANTGTQATTTSTRANTSDHHTHPAHARIKRNYKNNSKLIFFTFFSVHLCTINQNTKSNDNNNNKRTILAGSPQARIQDPQGICKCFFFYGFLL